MKNELIARNFNHAHANIIISGAMAKIWPLHHSDYSQCMGSMGEIHLAPLCISRGRGGVSTRYLHNI